MQQYGLEIVNAHIRRLRRIGQSSHKGERECAVQVPRFEQEHVFRAAGRADDDLLSGHW